MNRSIRTVASVFFILATTSFAQTSRNGGLAGGLAGPPLVLSSYIGNGYLAPDVSYDSTTGEYFVVFHDEDATSWPYWYSTGGQRISASGQPIGNPVCIECDPYLWSLTACVANVDGYHKFLVGADVTADFAGIGVAVAAVDLTAAFSSMTVLDWSGAGCRVAGDVAGGTTGICVWSGGPRWMKAALVDVGGPVATQVLQKSLFVAPTNTVIGGFAISKSGGVAGRYLICWQQAPDTGGQRDIWGLIVDRDLGVLDGPAAIQATARDERLPSVDGDGEHWVVAYQTDNDLECLGVFWVDQLSHAEVVPVAVTVVSDPTIVPSLPVVTWAGESFLVAFNETQAQSRMATPVLASVDPFSCALCEGIVALDNPGSIWLSGVVAQRSAGCGEDALAVWSDTGSLPRLHGRLFRAEDGIVTDLGGACGGGQAAATCARSPNPGFAFRLRNGPIEVPALLALSASASPVACGACDLLPDVRLGVVLSGGTTDRYGHATLPVAIPDDRAFVGASLVEQWWALHPGAGCGLAGGVATSNGISVTVQ